MHVTQNIILFLSGEFYIKLKTMYLTYVKDFYKYVLND